MLTSTEAPLVTATQWQQFERDGWLLLGPVADAATLALLRARCDGILHGTIRDEALMMQLDVGGDYGAMAPMTRGFKGATDAYRKIEGLERDPCFGAFLRHPRFAAWCRRAYGHGAISTFRAMLMNKPAQGGTPLPWHQDGGGIWGLDRDPLLTMWTALDDATIANGCVEIIPGSHRLGLLSAYGHTITAELEARHCPAAAVRPLEVPAGSTVVLHNWTLHRSGVNRTGRPRRAFSVCYMDARTRHPEVPQGFPIAFPAVS